MTEKKSLNFLCFCADQHRADHLSCAGNPVLETPNIDRIAAEGVSFERAYVNNPLCMPNRASLVTGQTPRAHGVRTNGVPLNPNVPTFTEALRKAGYHTHSVGKLHLHTFGLPRGSNRNDADAEQHLESSDLWDAGRVKKLPSPYYGHQTADFVGGHAGYTFGEYTNWLKERHPDAVHLGLREHSHKPPSDAPECWSMALPEELHYSRWIADRTIDFLREKARSGQPFYIWCSFPDPHHPFVAPEPYDEMYERDEMPEPVGSPVDLDEMPPHFLEVYETKATHGGIIGPTKMWVPHVNEIMQRTYGMIHLMDLHIGRVLDALEELGLAGNTAVSYMSDHGDLMGDHGLFKKGPFHYEGLIRVPFLWRLPGMAMPGRTTGALASAIDFAPTILDLAGVAPLEGRIPGSPVSERQREVLPGRSLAPVLTGEAGSVRETALIEYDADYMGGRLRTLVTERYKITAYQGESYGELFDLADDPNERRNLWDDPERRSLRDELQIELLHELIRTDSTLPRRMTGA